MGGLTSPLPCPWEGARACEKGTNTSHRQKFNCVEEGSETLSEHLAASGGQLFLKEVFINFVVRLGHDREWEEAEEGTGKQEFNLFSNQTGPVSVCASLKIFAAVPPFLTSHFLKKNIGLSWCLQQPERLLMLCLHKGLIIQVYI